MIRTLLTFPLLLMLIACGAPAAVPIAEVLSTPTTAPTLTIGPTAILAPTETLDPTVTKRPIRTPLPTFLPVADLPIEDALEAAGEIAPGYTGKAIKVTKSAPAAKAIQRTYDPNGYVDIGILLFERMDDRDYHYEGRRTALSSPRIKGTEVPLQIGESSMGKERWSDEKQTGDFQVVFVRCHAVVRVVVINAKGLTIEKITPFLERLDKELQETACR